MILSLHEQFTGRVGKALIIVKCYDIIACE